MDYQQDKIRVICEQLDRLRRCDAGLPLSFEVCPAGYKTGNTPPEGPWTGWKEDDRFRGMDSHFWFRAHFTAPAARPHSRLYFFVSTGYEGDWDSVNPQGIIYLNGELRQGVDINHRYVELTPGTEYELHAYMYTSLLRDVAPLFSAKLIWVDTDIEALYYDLRVPLDASACVPAGGEDYWRLLRPLSDAVDLIDLRNAPDEAFYESAAAARALLKKQLYSRRPDEEGPVVTCVGHTHIDVAWLWTIAQTREKAQRSFSTALRLMEAYPEYIFMSSQPQLLQFVREEAPELYEQIKARVREGRWELEGAMWLEADTNLTSGESLVRQILHGKRFMKEEFGADSHILWLPDVFGYSAALPQIMRKSGVDRFFTTKIGWNENNMMPVDAFMWQGIDGSEVFSFFGTAQDLPEPGRPLDKNTTYVCNTEPRMVAGTWNRFQQKEYSNHTLITFGHGDGGGGPTAHHLEVARRTSAGLPGIPRTEMGTVGAFMDTLYSDLQARCGKTHHIPRWVGELYLEFHRGTYTSVGKNKRNNRKAELLLQKTETLSALNSLLDKAPYPSGELHRSWENVLLNQFHDIIPGSSIHQVYEVTDREYAALFDRVGALSEAALRGLAAHIPGDGILVYNPLGFTRSGLVRLGGKTFRAENVPAMGWKRIAAAAAESTVAATETTLENRFYKLSLDRTGAIESLWDKAAERELALPGRSLNELTVFEDFPRDYDAWELSRYHADKSWRASDVRSACVVREVGRTGIRQVIAYDRSEITQTLYLYDESPRIDFVTEVEWHQQHQILKAVFPFDLHTEEGTFEIQFGHVKRPTHRNTSWDDAKFEVLGQKWADLSEDGYGVSLLNDCKYGHSAEGSTLRLSLLKGATYPDPQADQGRHCFTYSLLPHQGSFREGSTIREAYDLNQELMASDAVCEVPSLPAEFSLVSCDAPNIVIETFKQAEDGDGYILRFYEAWNRRSRVKLRFGLPVASVEAVDLMEEAADEPAVTLCGNDASLSVKCFEIVTLRVRFQ